MIAIISKRATASEIEQMLSEHKFYIKVVVDIERRILAGGGEMQSCLRTGFAGEW